MQGGTRHVEAAVKLLRWAAPPAPDVTPNAEADDLARLIAEARTALSEDSDLDDHSTAHCDSFTDADARNDEDTEETEDS